jgi:hypothetical protein
MEERRKEEKEGGVGKGRKGMEGRGKDVGGDLWEGEWEEGGKEGRGEGGVRWERGENR